LERHVIRLLHKKKHSLCFIPVCVIGKNVEIDGNQQIEMWRVTSRGKDLIVRLLVGQHKGMKGKFSLRIEKNIYSLLINFNTQVMFHIVKKCIENTLKHTH
jgi:hypothetical protein